MTGFALSVASCAGTTVGPIVSQAPNSSLAQPRTIALIVENDSQPPRRESRREKQLADAQMASTALTESMSKLLSSHQLVVVSANRPSDLVLHCRILDARSGSKALRVFVGYGAGKAALRVGVSLNDPGTQDRAPLLSFETNATSGRIPGGGFNAAALVGEALNALKKDGLPHEIDQTTENIDEQLTKYFAAQNWSYPKPLANRRDES